MREIEDKPELREAFARLREARGIGPGEGQTACCYALSRNHPLLQALDWILNVFNTKR